MKKITSKEIRKKLKSRLSSQRRIFNFDNNQILVLPILEHPKGIDNSIDKIKFYINENGEFLTLNNIDGIKIDNDGLVNVYDKEKAISLYYKKMDGSFDIVKNNNFDFSDLTIDHSPSIYTVLFTMYLNKTPEYRVLNEFLNKISKTKLSTKDIKIGGFKDKVSLELESSLHNNEILEAYKTIFDPIELEIIPKENNNANLSLSSLDYYLNNKN